MLSMKCEIVVLRQIDKKMNRYYSLHSFSLKELTNYKPYCGLSFFWQMNVPMQYIEFHL